MIDAANTSAKRYAAQQMTVERIPIWRSEAWLVRMTNAAPINSLHGSSVQRSPDMGT